MGGEDIVMSTIRGTNASLVAERLHAHGVRYAFGIPSGQILPVVEACERRGIRFILVSHEMTAGFMADVMGRLTGIPGVAIATLGPGATNVATGVGNALLDRSPCLVLTPQVPEDQRQRRVQMRIDHQALFAPLTKASLRLTPAAVGDGIDRAVALATAEPPGPVHLDLPEDVLGASIPSRPGRASLAMGKGRRSARGLAAAVRALRRAERPVAVLGLTAARLGVGREVRRLLERSRIPFVTTMMGKGVVPEDHPLHIGVVGRARHKWVEGFLADADCILGIGYDPVELGYEDWMPAVPLVHVDPEPVDVAPRVSVAAEAGGDLAENLAALVRERLPRTVWDLEAIRGFRERLHDGLRPRATTFQPHQVLDLLREWLPADGILACDVGAHTHIIASQWPVTEPNTLLVSNGWSSMGYGIPAAMAATLAAPGRRVACVVGDGGFLMQAGEMATAARLGRPVLFVILRDGSLSLIEAKQRGKGYRIAAVRLFPGSGETPGDYFGVPCLAVRSPREFARGLQVAARARGPVAIEAHVDGSLYAELLYGRP
jgi:acetolactate synthase-1/2/3 large subunit